MKDLSLHILDIAQNSVAAGASLIEIALTADISGDLLTLVITDDGCGMSAEFVEKVLNPFVTTRTTRKVGLGLPLLKAGAERSGGEMRIVSQQGKGTAVTATYRISSIDRPPLGDVAGSVLSLVMMNPQTDFSLVLRVEGKEPFEFSTREVREQLSGVPLDTPDVLAWMKEYLTEGTECIMEVQ